MIRLEIPQSALAFIFIDQRSRTPLQVGLYKNFQNKTKPTRITTGQTGLIGRPLNCQNWLSTHGLIGEEQGRGEECSVGEERQRGGEGVLVVVGRQWSLMRIRGTPSLCSDTHRGLSWTVRGRGAYRPKGRVILDAGSVFLHFKLQN